MSDRKPRRWVKLFMFSFAPKLRSGAKSTTIRPLPMRAQDWPKEGDTIDARHWSGKPYRSRQAKIMTARIIRVVEIHLYDFGITIKNRDGSREGLNAKADSEAVDAIAKADGFDSWHDMGLWFQSTHGLPFKGILIEWDTTTISRGTARAGGLGSSPTPDLATGVGEAKSPAGNDAIVAELRAEIARLTRENAELEAEVAAITREPAEVRCQELAAMVFQGQQRNLRMFERIDELMTAGAALHSRLLDMGSLRSTAQIRWLRVLRKKPSDYQPKQPHTPSH